MWIELAPKKSVTVASLKTWLQKKYKPNNATHVKVLVNELKRFGVYDSHITFDQMVNRLAIEISCKAAKSPWVQVLADVATENIQEENIEEAAPSESLARVSETHDDASSSGPEHQNSRLNVANEEEDAANLIPDPLVLEPQEVTRCGLLQFFKLFFKS
jgi:hypothetical protein